MRNPAILIAAAGLALSACATSEGPSRYQQEYDALVADCRERGGILVANPGVQSGNPGADNSCRISGGASRLD